MEERLTVHYYNVDNRFLGIVHYLGHELRSPSLSILHCPYLILITIYRYWPKPSPWIRTLVSFMIGYHDGGCVHASPGKLLTTRFARGKFNLCHGI